MTRVRFIELSVGVFMLFGMIAFLFLAFRVSGLTQYVGQNAYQVTANFDNIGDLKVRAPVRVAGVWVGQVTNIDLNPETYQARVTVSIIANQSKLPLDSSASILTEGLLGANYISLTPGFSNQYLKAGDQIAETQSAIMLQNLIGSLMFNVNKGKSEEKTAT